MFCKTRPRSCFAVCQVAVSSSACVLSWLWFCAVQRFVEITSKWCWGYTWDMYSRRNDYMEQTFRIEKDRSSSSACVVTFFLHAAVFFFLWFVFTDVFCFIFCEISCSVWATLYFLKTVSMMNLSGCVCIGCCSFLNPRLIGLVFFCLCAKERLFLDFL